MARTAPPLTCLVTGATSGIGFATARGLAESGAHVILGARNEAKAKTTLRALESATGSERLELALADLSVQSEVRLLAETVARKHSRLDLLVNNAGLVSSSRQVTADGIELTWAVNHLAPFLLTNLLSDLLVASAPARVVMVASRGQGRAAIDLDDPQFERRPYTLLRAYDQSKLANVMFTVEMARRLRATGVTANCLHPGFVVTELGRGPSRPNLLWKIVRRFAVSAEKGARTSLYLALSPDIAGVTGKYFVGTRAVEPNRLASDVGLTARLWEVSAAMTGLAQSHGPA